MENYENDEKSNNNLPIQLWSGKEVSSPSKKSTKNEVLSIHETAKKLNIIPESDESNEDESIAGLKSADVVLDKNEDMDVEDSLVAILATPEQSNKALGIFFSRLRLKFEKPG